MNRFLFIFGLILLLGATPCLGEPDQLEQDGPDFQPMEASFSVDSASFGDIIPLSLKFALPDEARLIEPLKISGLAPDTLTDWSRTEEGVDLNLIVNTLDLFEIEELTLAIKDGQGRTAWLQSEPLKITINSGLPDDPSKLSPRPIKGIIPAVPPWKRHLVLGLCILAAVLVLCVGAWFLLNRRKKEIEGPPPIPPHEIALSQLNNLDREWEDSTAGDKNGYFRLSMIIRSYMGAIRPFPAEDLTTDEIRAKASDRFDREMLKVLTDADMIKFAGARAATATRVEHMELARWYVDKTIPADENSIPGPEKEEME